MRNITISKNIKFITIITIIMVIILPPGKARAEGLSLGISPPILQITAIPPASIEAPLTIENLGDETVDLAIILKPFTAGKNENGELVYLADNVFPGPDPLLPQRIQILDNGHSIKALTLPPGQGKKLSLHIGIPKEEPLADYYFSIVFVSKAQEEDQRNVSQAAGGIAANVLLSIGPKGSASGTIEEFSAPSFLEKGPVPFTVRVKNTGQHVVAPKGVIVIKNMFGQIVGNVDLLPVNILAGTTRAIPDSLQTPDTTASGNIKFPISNFKYPIAYWNESFLLGAYNATLTIALTDDGPVFTRDINFIGFPVQIAIGLFVVIAIIFIIKNRLKRKLVAVITLLILFTFFPNKSYAASLRNASDILSINQASTPSAAVKAVHAISFTTVTALPTGGTLVVTFPAAKSSETNSASASANTFMPNTITAGNITANFSAGVANCNFTISTFTPAVPWKITCALTNAVAASTTVTILVGCTTKGTSCPIENQVPTLINPLKTAKKGTTDVKNVRIETFSAGSTTVLDRSVVRAGTLEGVTVSAAIQPTFSFSISGLPNNTPINTALGCGTSHSLDTSNTGFATTATSVNLGNLTTGVINRAFQKLGIASNAINGYVINATSSGSLRASSNAVIADAQGSPTANDMPAPKPITPSNAAFGIHACDLNGKVSQPLWGKQEARFANPSPNFFYTIVNSPTSPADPQDIIYVEYAAAVVKNTPTGDYHTAITYLAVPTF